MILDIVNRIIHTIYLDIMNTFFFHVICIIDLVHFEISRFLIK